MATNKGCSARTRSTARTPASRICLSSDLDCNGDYPSGPPNRLELPVRSSFIGDRVYENPVTIGAQIESWTAQNLSSAKFLLDATTTLSNDTLSDYDVQEQVAAVYGMAKLGFGKWSVLGGVRVEQTRTDAEGYRLMNAKAVEKQRTKSDYVDVLPNLHIRFDPRRDDHRGRDDVRPPGRRPRPARRPDPEPPPLEQARAHLGRLVPLCLARRRDDGGPPARRRGRPGRRRARARCGPW